MREDDLAAMAQVNKSCTSYLLKHLLINILKKGISGIS